LAAFWILVQIIFGPNLRKNHEKQDGHKKVVGPIKEQEAVGLICSAKVSSIPKRLMHGPTRSGATEELEESMSRLRSAPVRRCTLLHAANSGQPSKIERTIDFLREQLADGAVEAKDVIEAGEAEGFSERTLREAKKRCGIKAVRTSFTGPWRWRLASTPELRDE
jgi:hypothetical protein